MMAIIMGLFITAALAKKERGRKGVFVIELAGMIISGLAMVAGYFAAEMIMYGNWGVALLGIPWNIGQFSVGMAIAVALSAALYKTPARLYFRQDKKETGY